MPYRAAPRRSSASFRAAIRAGWACRSTRPALCCAPPAIRLAEWLYEAGIGENRAILVEDEEILVASIELQDEMRCGSVLGGRLVSIPIRGRRGIVETERGQVMVEPLS